MAANNDRTRIPVPIIPYQTNRRAMLEAATLPPITFDYADGRMGAPGLGVWIRDLRGQGDNTPISGMHDSVFPPNVDQINFRIIWPGYEAVDNSGYIQLTKANGTRLTRVELGRRVADRIVLWYFDVKNKPTRSHFPLGDSQRRVTYQDMYLVRLVNTVGNVWQADIVVDRTPPPSNLP
ncbi:hypothetical protein MIND_00209000 [Mycena indigotica]|uniref:Uncharacterized protein n=1 Tax=Mycena indigotica TaxID=2126181 RepID=A0A8H6WEL3_9AGAR|nr:uncharacterized protein MIND_00209000 [Mycena indigotica]KAF7311973.1 hypothetical protein MIND_00209000 [Mycena indigotica]